MRYNADTYYCACLMWDGIEKILKNKKPWVHEAFQGVTHLIRQNHVAHCPLKRDEFENRSPKSGVADYLAAACWFRGNRRMAPFARPLSSTYARLRFVCLPSGK